MLTPTDHNISSGKALEDDARRRVERIFLNTAGGKRKTDNRQLINITDHDIWSNFDIYVCYIFSNI